MREKSIFYNLTDENENATTELLCNLCIYDEYREIIFNILGLNNFDIYFDDIQTQKQIPKKRKKPDITIENNEAMIFIENKINAGLLKSQIKTYPDELNRSNKKKKMIYLVPNNHKCIETINELSQKYDFITLVRWEELVNKLEKYNKSKSSEIITESTKYFNKVLNMIPKTMFSQEDILFMKDIVKFRRENNTMAKAAELFSNVVDKLGQDLKIKSDKDEPRLVCDQDEFGYYFSYMNCFFGYSFGLLEHEKPEAKDYVLSLALHKDGVKVKKINDFSEHPFYFDEEWYFFKFDQDILSNDEKEKLLFDSCSNILKELLKV
jgi:hypothetical protein